MVTLISVLRWVSGGLRLGLLWRGKFPSSATLSTQLADYFLLQGESGLGVSTDGLVTALALFLGWCLVGLLLLIALLYFFIGDK